MRAAIDFRPCTPHRCSREVADAREALAEARAREAVLEHRFERMLEDPWGHHAVVRLEEVDAAITARDRAIARLQEWSAD